jgi:hypothetical protein
MLACTALCASTAQADRFNRPELRGRFSQLIFAAELVESIERRRNIGPTCLESESIEARRSNESVLPPWTT